MDSLQHDKRCPTCRNNVTQQRSDDAENFDEMYDNGFAEQAAIVVESRLALKVDADRMRIMLRTNFGVKEQDLRHLNKRKLAACLAEQLLSSVYTSRIWNGVGEFRTGTRPKNGSSSTGLILENLPKMVQVKFT